MPGHFVQTKTRISLSSILVVAKEQVSSELAGGVIMLDLKSGVYYGLEDVGARIWGLLQEPISVSDIRDILLEEYDVSAEQCERHLLSLLEEMESRALIEIKNESMA
jgi:hypothetical protein